MPLALSSTLLLQCCKFTTAGDFQNTVLSGGIRSLGEYFNGRFSAAVSGF